MIFLFKIIPVGMVVINTMVAPITSSSTLLADVSVLKRNRVTVIL